jgi:uncharacterized protein YndB with AHSA1/START domain
MDRVLATHIDIAAAPERVWEVLVDLPAWNEWNPFIPSIAGRLEVGTRLRMTVRPPGMKAMEFKPKVMAVRSGAELIWGWQLPPLRLPWRPCDLARATAERRDTLTPTRAIPRTDGAFDGRDVRTDGAGLPSDEPGSNNASRVGPAADRARSGPGADAVGCLASSHHYRAGRAEPRGLTSRIATSPDEDVRQGPAAKAPLALHQRGFQLRA